MMAGNGPCRVVGFGYHELLGRTTGDGYLAEVVIVAGAEPGVSALALQAMR